MLMSGCWRFRNVALCFSLAVLAGGCGSKAHKAGPTLPDAAEDGRDDGGGDDGGGKADAAFVCNPAEPPASTVCDVKDFGAVGDGVAYDTVAVQATIDWCGQIAKCAATQATVRFPTGTYLLLPILLRSNVTLQVDSGAKVQFTPDVDAFPKSSGFPVAAGLMNAPGVNHVSITGAGVIDGGGGAGANQWWGLFRSTWDPANQDFRPHLLYVTNSQYISISGVTFQNSPKFHLFFQSTDYIDITGVTINAPASSPNTDGIDPKSCRHVKISDCDISVGDDNVAVTSNPRGGIDPTSDDVVVTNCRFGRGHGMSIGSPTYGDIGALTVQHVTFTGTDNGIRIKSTRGSGGKVGGEIHGATYNLVYDDIQMTNVRSAITLTEYYSDIPKPGVDTVAQAVTVTSRTPDYANITISNLTAVNTSSTGAPGGSAGIIIGLPETPITNVIFKNVHISARTGLSIRNASGIQFIDSDITVASGGAVILQENAEETGLPGTPYVPPDAGTIEAGSAAPDGAPDGGSNVDAGTGEDVPINADDAGALD
jgi:polygalacturonase